MEPKQPTDKQTEKRYALLIDADNVSAKYVAVILDELSKYGTVTYKRIYGDWTSTLHSKWKDTLLENSITPIQQFSYTQGKNATDHAMIIDAMDILYTGQVDGFCIASSDSDFTRLAARIRESGLTVIGMGEKKTPLAFRKACDIFTTLEILLDEVPTKRGRKHTGHAPEGPAPSIAIERIEEAVSAIVTYNLNNGKATGLGEVGSRLQKRYPDFDVRSYGTNQLRKLLEGFDSVSVTQEGNSISVVLVDEANGQALGEDAPAHADNAGESPADPKQPEDAKQPAEASSKAPVENGKGKRTRRGGKRRKSTVIAAQNDSDEPKASAPDVSDQTTAAAIDDQPKPQPAQQPQKPAPSDTDMRGEVERYIKGLLANAEDSGISLQVLGKRVRSKFRSFRLHDLGYTKFKDLVKDIDGIDIEQRENASYARTKEN